jgi:hypothetical protein
MDYASIECETDIDAPLEVVFEVIGRPEGLPGDPATDRTRQPIHDQEAGLTCAS